MVGTAALGIWLIASAIEGYLLGLGWLDRGIGGAIARLLLFASGMAMALPGGGELGLSHIQLAGLGVGLGVIGALIALVNKRYAARAPARG